MALYACRCRCASCLHSLPCPSHQAHHSASWRHLLPLSAPPCPDLALPLPASYIHHAAWPWLSSGRPLQACGAPVSLSRPVTQDLAPLHEAARAAAAAHPLSLPEDSNSSLRRLVEAVRRQKDPQAAVTTALVAVLHVPSRPRLAFPGGRPSKRHAAGASPGQQRDKEGAGAAGREGREGSQDEEREGEREKLPDASNYLDGFPSVKSLIEQFR